MSMLKKCNGCKIIKDVKEFYIRPYYKDVYRSKCKECDKIRNKKYREKNKNKIKEKSKEYYENNKEKKKEYYENNKTKINEYIREYHKKRTSNDPLYKLSKRMRGSIFDALRNNGYTKNSKSNKILGCSYPELLNHLNDNEYGFVYGDVNLDIDHIIPLNKATTKKEIIKLNHYSNLQLLPSRYNRYIKRDNDFDKEDLKKWLEENKNK